MIVFEIFLLIVSLIGAYFFFKKEAPPYIIIACLALAVISACALGFFDFLMESN